MSYNQFLTAQLSQDGKSLFIEGETLNIASVKSIDVSVAPFPDGGEFPAVLAEAEFRPAKQVVGNDLDENPWSSKYPLATPNEYSGNDVVLVTGRATYKNDTVDIWAERLDVFDAGQSLMNIAKPPH